MHDERNSLTQQIGVLQLQLQQAHDRQAQLREHYSKEAQLHIDSVVASAAAREAARVSNIQTGSADFVLLQQLKQARQKLVGAQQEAENWKGASSYWADQAAQSEIAIETLARQLAEFGGRSGAERPTFSERCASQQRDISATYGLERMFASVSQAPSRAPISDMPKPAGRPAASGAHGHAADDELLKSPSSDDEDRKRRRTHLKALVLDPFPPNALGFRRWQLIFHSNICFASRHDSDSNMVWVQYVEMSGVTIADLGVSGKCWDDLDIALAEAVLKMVSGSLLKDILYYQDTRGKEHKLMPGRAALMYVYRKYALGAAGPLAVDLQTLMHLKFNGDLESFIHAWDACLLAIEAVPVPNFLLSLLEPKLRECKQLSPAFAHLDGQLKLIYKAARREIDSKRRDKIKNDFMRPIPTSGAALFAAGQKTAEAGPAADDAAAGTLPPRRPRIRSPRQPQTAALVATPPLPPLGTCYSFSKDGICTFENRCMFKHIDSNVKELPKPKAAAKPKLQAKKRLGTFFPRQGSR